MLRSGHSPKPEFQNSMTTTLFIAIICGIGLGIGLFFGIHLLGYRRLQNTILGILLIVLSLRIAKSVFYNFIELPVYIKNLGLAANLAVGPLLYLYGRSLKEQLKKISKLNFLHFVPSLGYIVFCTYIPNDFHNDIWRISYSFILLHSFVYVTLSLFLFYKKPPSIKKELIDWYLKLVGALATIWIIYALIFIKVLPVYAAGPIAFSILIFLLSFLGFSRRKIFEGKAVRKYLNSKISFEEGKVYLDKLRNLLEHENLYLDSTLSLQTLSSRLGLSGRDVSLIINRHARKNFSSFINEYRVEEAKKLLRTRRSNTKILAIALDSGFNNLSSFNVAFKAFTKATPSEYRLKHSSENTA